MKYLFTDQNFHISKLFHEFNFLRTDIYVNKRKHYKYLIFFIVKFNYFTGPNILQIYFIFITYPIVASLCSLVFPETSLRTDPEVSATNLQT